jgi:hypothetical protein
MQMLETNNEFKLSIRHQAKLLGVSRARVYYKCKSIMSKDAEIANLIKVYRNFHFQKSTAGQGGGGWEGLLILAELEPMQQV